MKCFYKISETRACAANSMKNNDYCFTHNPLTKNEHLEAASKGGRALQDMGSNLLPPLKLKQVSDIVSLLENTINHVRVVKDDGKMEIKVANCIGYLAGQLIKAIEVSDITTRLEIIERVILERKSIIRK